MYLKTSNKLYNLECLSYAVKSLQWSVQWSLKLPYTDKDVCHRPIKCRIQISRYPVKKTSSKEYNCDGSWIVIIIHYNLCEKSAQKLRWSVKWILKYLTR